MEDKNITQQTGESVNLDKDKEEYLDSTLSQINEAFRKRIEQVASEGGDVDRTLDKWRDFSNSLMGTLTSMNMEPENFDIAIEGSAALLTPEAVIGRGYEEGAQEMVTKLTKRYSTVKSG